MILQKLLTVFFSIHNPPFSALRGFQTSRNESPSRVTRSPNLVLRGFHNLRLISFAALCQWKCCQSKPRQLVLWRQKEAIYTIDVKRKQRVLLYTVVLTVKGRIFYCWMSKNFERQFQVVLLYYSVSQILLHILTVMLHANQGSLLDSFKLGSLSKEKPTKQWWK